MSSTQIAAKTLNAARDERGSFPKTNMRSAMFGMNHRRLVLPAAVLIDACNKNEA